MGILPEQPEAAALEHALERYRVIAAEGGWPQQPRGMLLRPGDDPSPTVLSGVLVRLRATRDLSSNWTLPEDQRGYTGAIVEAVRRFQERHGLIVDGIIGPQTLEAMNVPVEERIRQMEINVERWRELPLWRGERYVLVNIPEFRVRLIEYGREVLSLPVIVGTPRRPTPVLTDQIEYVVFRPYWNVPARIVREELLPKAATDPAYLTRSGYEVVDHRPGSEATVDPIAVDWSSDRWNSGRLPFLIRQRPGPRNALGLVKFMFPNEHQVYLHDTPARGLFQRARRAFSHGCVRVAEPAKLAAALLAGDPWTHEDVERAMYGNDRRVIVLRNPVHIYLRYLTSWVDADGSVHFRRDIYRHNVGR